MDEFDADELRGTDDLLVVREAVIDGRTFRLRAHRTLGSGLEISFESHDDQGRDAGGLAGTIPVNDLLPAAKALSKLVRGIAATLGPAQTGADTRYDEVRRNYPNAWRSWTTEDDQRLSQLHGEGLSIDALTHEFGRRPGGIRARLEKLGLIEAGNAAAATTDNADDHSETCEPQSSTSS